MSLTSILSCGTFQGLKTLETRFFNKPKVCELDCNRILISLAKACMPELHSKDLEGVCYAAQIMGVQAVCTEEVENFNARMDKIRELMIQGSYTSYEDFKKHPSADSVAIKIQNDMEELLSDVEKNRSQIKELLEITDFIQRIAILQTKIHSDELAGNALYPDEALRRLLQSDKLRSKGGVTTVDAHAAIHTQDTLEKYIREFKLLAEQSCIRFCVLSLTIENHAITLIYDSQKYCWWFIDVNRFPIRAIFNDQEAAKEIFKSIQMVLPVKQKEQRFLIKTDFQVLGEDKTKCQSRFKKLLGSKRFRSLYSIKPTVVDTQDSNGRTALCVSVSFDTKLSVVQSLLDRGANVNNVSRAGYAPLTTAIGLGRLDIFRLLLKYGADPNVKSNYPPLTIALLSRQSIMVKELLEAGAEPLMLDKDGNTALDYDQDLEVADFFTKDKK